MHVEVMRALLFPSGHVLNLAAAIVSAAWIASATPLLAQGSGTPPNPEAAFERCQAIKDDAARLYCYENSAQAGAGGRLPNEVGTWHLLRTPNPSGGPPAVSVMQSADIPRSDPDLAGLMIRCGESSTEVLIVLVRYLRLGTHPKVTVGTGPTSTEFTGDVVPPGLLVLLPPQATSLALGPWQALPEIAVSIDDESGRISGVIPLAGVKGALQILRSNCPAR
jgi:hypothetical protein